jgi:hypothetical protein
VAPRPFEVLRALVVRSRATPRQSFSHPRIRALYLNN